MKEFILPKTGGVARIDILGEGDLLDILALQEATLASLPADKKMFILAQDQAYFRGLLSQATGLMIGIRAEGKLIAQIALKGPMDLREAIVTHSITKNDEVPFHHAALSDSIIVLKSMAVLPDWRGNDLACNLVSFTMELPFTRSVDHVFAQISAGNKRSWGCFVKQGFGIVAACYDPNDKQPRFIFQKPSFGLDLEPAILADDVDAKTDFAAIVTLTQREGLIGIYDENSTDKLAFLRSYDAQNILPVIAKMHVAK